MSTLFREISDLKVIFKAQDNEIANDCLGTQRIPSQPVELQIRKTTVPRAPVARATGTGFLDHQLRSWFS
jgi:hypothetical protein